jgi:hypothetical protein
MSIRSVANTAGSSTEQTSHILDIGGKTYSLILENKIVVKTPIWLPEEKLEPPLSVERVITIAQNEIKKHNPNGIRTIKLWEVNLLTFSDLEKRWWYYIVSFWPGQKIDSDSRQANSTDKNVSSAASKFVPVVLVLMSGEVIAGEEFEVPESPQLPHYQVDLDNDNTITDNSTLRRIHALSGERLASAILWNPETSPAPPLSIGEAVNIARRELSKYVSDQADYKLESVLLQPGIRQGATWIWFFDVAFYPQPEEKSFDEKLSNIKPGEVVSRPSSGIRIGVLMSGASLGLL